MQDANTETIWTAAAKNLFKRLWQYQYERFPLARHGLLIAIFSSAGVSLSTILRHSDTAFGLCVYLVAFVSALLFFLELRIIDEFKDFDEDSRYRPYRPVPRGLVSLGELRDVFFASCLVQAFLAVMLCPGLIPSLLAVWIFLALLSKEFFLGPWLRRHPVVYMSSHMAILPVIDYYITACEWLPRRHGPPVGLVWFLAVSFFNGMVIEIGRKLRAPEEEEMGVDTYSFLWGLPQATIIWMCMMLVTAGLAVVTAYQFGLEKLLLAILCIVLTIAGLRSVHLVRAKNAGTAGKFETLAGLWTICLYTNLGILPLIFKHWSLS